MPMILHSTGEIEQFENTPDFGVDQMIAYLRNNPGKHMWGCVGAWQLDDPEQTVDVRLDSDHLLSVAGPICLLCEKLYGECKDERCGGMA